MAEDAPDDGYAAVNLPLHRQLATTERYDIRANTLRASQRIHSLLHPPGKKARSCAPLRHNAQIDVADLRENARRGQLGRILQRRVASGKASGYDIAPGEERGERPINQGEATNVRTIFQLFAAGVSPRAIAHRLNDEAVPSPWQAVAGHHDPGPEGARHRPAQQRALCALILASGSSEAGLSSCEPAGIIDIAPIVLGLLGLEKTATMQGRNLASLARKDPRLVRFEAGRGAFHQHVDIVEHAGRHFIMGGH